MAFRKVLGVGELFLSDFFCLLYGNVVDVFLLFEVFDGFFKVFWNILSCFVVVEKTHNSPR